jgi:hypothetical protein
MGWTRPSLAPPAPRAIAGRKLPSARVPASAAEIAAKLNLFQRTMLRWRELHPYSAAHAVRVPKPLEQARLEHLITRRLAAIGLTGLVLDPRRGWLRREWVADPVELKVLADGGDPLAALWNELEAQLNTPFPHAGRVSAFRFLAVPANDGFYLGLVYDHFIAGGDAIALLMKGVVDDYSHAEAVTPPAPRSRLAPPLYRGLLLHHPLSVLWATLRLPSFIACARRSIRPPGSRDGNPYNALGYLRLGPDDVEGLRRAATAWGVTLNDLLLASLLLTLAPLAPERTRARRRRELAVASIVNIRPDLPASAADTFGPFLASFHVSHAVPTGIGLRQLAQDVHAESARIKRERLYVQTLAGLGVSGLMWPFLSPGQRERFFSKYHPVWGGVSLLNINAVWERAGGGEAAPGEYIRAVSTGPACPLVLTVTAARDVLHVGISFRADVFSRATVEGVKAAFARSIESLREGPGE